MGHLKTALEVNPTACALDPVISLYRIGSRSFIDEGGGKHFLSLCGQLPPELSLLSVSWYHLPWCLETLPLTLCTYSSSVFYTFFKGGSSFHMSLMLLLLNVFTLVLGLLWQSTVAS